MIDHFRGLSQYLDFDNISFSQISSISHFRRFHQYLVFANFAYISWLQHTFDVIGSSDEVPNRVDLVGAMTWRLRLTKHQNIKYGALALTMIS